MLEGATTFLSAYGYKDIEIVWKWGSTSHDIEAKKGDTNHKFKFYVFRGTDKGDYWMAQTGGKGSKTAMQRTKVIFSLAKRYYAIPHTTYKKLCGNKDTFNISLNLDIWPGTKPEGSTKSFAP